VARVRLIKMALHRPILRIRRNSNLSGTPFR
jgi:hypothetical protein